MQKRLRSEEESRPVPADPPWLAADIRVRIIDKALRGGALYLKKVVAKAAHGCSGCRIETTFHPDPGLDPSQSPDPTLNPTPTPKPQS